jgi:hypothetical protein
MQRRQSTSKPPGGTTMGETAMNEEKRPKREPGVCVPWEEKLKELPEIAGDEDLVKRTWEDIDALGYMYIWHCLVSF